MSENINSRIKQVRLKYGLSQTDFGKNLGVTRGVISNIEYDKVKPNDEFVQLVSYIYNIDYDWLVEGKGVLSDNQIEETKRKKELEQLIDKLPVSMQEYLLKQAEDLLMLSKSTKDEQSADTNEQE